MLKQKRGSRAQFLFMAWKSRLVLICRRHTLVVYSWRTKIGNWSAGEFDSCVGCDKCQARYSESVRTAQSLESQLQSWRQNTSGKSVATQITLSDYIIRLCLSDWIYILLRKRGLAWRRPEYVLFLPYAKYIKDRGFLCSSSYCLLSVYSVFYFAALKIYTQFTLIARSWISGTFVAISNENNSPPLFLNWPPGQPNICLLYTSPSPRD